MISKSGKKQNKGKLFIFIIIGAVLLFSGITLIQFIQYNITLRSMTSPYHEYYTFSNSKEGYSVLFITSGFNIEDNVESIAGRLQVYDNYIDDSVRLQHTFPSLIIGVITFKISTNDVEKTTVYTLESSSGIVIIEVKIEDGYLKLKAKESVNNIAIIIQNNVWYAIKITFNFDDDIVYKGLIKSRMTVEINGVKKMTNVNIAGSSIGKFAMKTDISYENYRSYLDDYTAIFVKEM